MAIGHHGRPGPVALPRVTAAASTDSAPAAGRHPSTMADAALASPRKSGPATRRNADVSPGFCLATINVLHVALVLFQVHMNRGQSCTIAYQKKFLSKFDC